MKLEIQFHGRVIEHLGIDMYQSPVAAIAELVSNAWDADASAVNIELPKSLGPDAMIRIKDDGLGMTFEECQARYLKVGFNKRKTLGSATSPGGRPLMGRKGIGKFAGFGIARVVWVKTISEATGECTTFSLDIAKLLGTDDEYVNAEPLEVDLIAYLGPDEIRRNDHGTVLELRSLTMTKAPNVDQFRKSMARRFLLQQTAADFAVTVDGEPLPESEDLAKIEFDFPSAYRDGEMPTGMSVVDGWGVEQVNGHELQWRFAFHKETISEEELAGIVVFSHGKLAQRPFLFNLSGGFGGQHGVPYLAGRVKADFIDEQAADLISTERQRINWEAPAARPLLEWGQSRIKALLKLWQERRAQEKVASIDAKVSQFSQRLGKLPTYERRIVRRALTAIARISVLSEEQFADTANAILVAWEGGRLKDFIAELADAEDMDAEALVKILTESNVMTALHAAESVKAKLNLIRGLSERIQTRELENAIRDYIADNPWLVNPRWETFKRETGVQHLLDQAANEAGLRGDDWSGRVDLALASGEHLLVLEFMRPGLTADWDHVDRYERYVRILRRHVIAATRFNRVDGLLVADGLAKKQDVVDKLAALRSEGMEARDWPMLLADAEKQWRDYFEILYSRAPDDERMRDLATQTHAVDLEAETLSAESELATPGENAAI